MIERVFWQDKEIVLVGTAHISEESVKLAKEAIEKERPDIVGVELDTQRYAQLKQGDRWKETNIVQIIKTGQTYLFLVNLLLANLQRRLGQKVGVMPGQEMLEAMKTAEENGIRVALLDRNVRVTLKRAMSLMGIMEKLKLFYAIVSGLFGFGDEVVTKEKIEELKHKDMMTELMESLSKEMPNVKKVLVDERDLFIANRILRAPGRKIVAVIGAGHLEGVKKYLDRKRDVSDINVVPKKKSYWRYLKWLVPVLFAGIIGYGIMVKGLETGLWLLAYWFLINGVLSALGVLVARGRPLSILTAFLAAPFTSLHPFLAAGWFAGLAEAKASPPKVNDFEGLRKLNSVRDYYSNRVTKILLVTALANLGSTIGTVVALPYILSVLV